MAEHSQGQATYGHALYEFCIFRKHSRDYTRIRIPLLQLITGLDVFKGMLFTIGKKDFSRLAPTANFFEG